MCLNLFLHVSLSPISACACACGCGCVSDCQVGHVTDSIGDGVVFQLELKDRNYILRTSTVSEAEKWMYKLRMLRDEAKSLSIPEESAQDSRNSSSSTRSPAKTAGGGGRGADGEWSKANIEISGGGGGGDEKKACCTVS